MPATHRGSCYRCDQRASGRVEDDFNLYAYVGNDPLNRSDPFGEQACETAAAEGQSGDCIEATNYDPDKANPTGPDADVVQPASIDQEVVNISSSLESTGVDEPVATLYESEDGSVNTAFPAYTTADNNGTLETTFGVRGADDSVAHAHPNDISEVAHGPGDDAVINTGRTNNVVHDSKVITGEKRANQFYSRALKGTLTPQQRK